MGWGGVGWGGVRWGGVRRNRVGWSGEGWERGGGSHFMRGRSGMTIWYRPSHPHNAGTEHVGLSPTRQTS